MTVLNKLKYFFTTKHKQDIQYALDKMRLHFMLIFLSLYDFAPEIGLWCVPLLCLVLCVVAFPIGDGQQPPRKGFMRLIKYFLCPNCSRHSPGKCDECT